MYLERLDIQGFKSFAQPTTLIFNKELTAIVGPNGSGKSNVADAIRWVLGEQSLKLLRGKKSDDVIFAGSDKKGRMGFARVVITMNNENHAAGIEYDQIIIGRTIDRSGESEYILNNNRARLADILLLLAKAQVGQKSYSVIGQGTIDTLLALSAQERKDLFDEATGVRQYQMKKNQALHKLERTEENIAQAELVLHEITPRLHTLTRQVRRLEKKEDLERQLRAACNDYYSSLSHEITGQLQTLTARKEREDKRLEAFAAEQKSIQLKLDQHERAQGRQDSFNLLQKKLFDLQQEFNTLTKKKIVLEGQRELDMIKTGQQERVALTRRLHDVGGKIGRLLTSMQELSIQEKNLTAAAVAHRQHMEASHERLRRMEKEMSSSSSAPDWNAIRLEAHALHADHDAITGRLLALRNERDIDLFRERFSVFAARLKKFLAALAERREEKQDILKEFSELNSEHRDLVKRAHDAETELRVAAQERKLLSDQQAQLEAEQRSLQAELDRASGAGSPAPQNEPAELARELAEKEREIQRIRREIDAFNASEESKKQELVELQKKIRTLQYDFTIQNNALTGLKVEMAKLETRKEDLEAEIRIEAPDFELQPARKIHAAQTRETIATLKRQLNIIGGIDAETVQEYREVKDKHTYLTQQTADLKQAAHSLTKLIEDLNGQINRQFQDAFKSINAHFTNYFKRLFQGGNAKLSIQIQKQEDEERAGEEERADAETPVNKPETKSIAQKYRDLDYTVEIQATPPGKKVASINVLSGGEKALTAISLVCAIIANNPPPFVVLDEVDAALDEANSIRFAEIITELKDKTQFITITHNRATMHQAKILYGVSMSDDGISQLLSVNFDQADKLSA